MKILKYWPILVALVVLRAQNQQSGGKSNPAIGRITPEIVRALATGMPELMEAAARGDKFSQFVLGMRYDAGNGVPKDPAQAVGWYRKAAAQGVADAQYLLGSKYDEGEGVLKDAAQAVEWYRKSADQGHAMAQFSLGFMYAAGNGVPKDAAQAVGWYRKAAEQGDADAQNNLGLAYMKGNGVRKDLVLAYMWANLAAAQSRQGSGKLRDDLERIMTQGQIAEAQKLSREWKSK